MNVGYGKIRTRGKGVDENFMTKGELRSVGTANEKKERK